MTVSRESKPLSWHLRVANLNRSLKRLVMVLADLVVLPLALWSGFALRYATWWPAEQMLPFWFLFVLVPLVGVVLFAGLGLYRAVVRFMGLHALLAVVKGVGLLALLMAAGMYFYGEQAFPRSVPIHFALVALIYVGGTRLLVRSYYQWLVKHYANKEPVIIYGAGGSGVQLAMALANGGEFYPVAFLDDDPSLQGSSVQGIRVYAPTEAERLIAQEQVERVLLAMPKASKLERKRALDHFSDISIHVQTVPSMPEIVSGRAALDQLREVELEDLLGRDPVPPQKELLAASVTDKVVMVTGAGGSIGSELCRQLLALRPKKLLLYDISEFSLYTIDQELQQLAWSWGCSLPILAVLGSVAHRSRVEAVIQRHQVETLYHAAAYKHVPLVEHNQFEGIRNNVLGTQVVAEAALKLGVERFILISTDKAVRPTNVMGASKRLAELIVQDLAVAQGKTVFSMIRFGNVLGSSGSVVPLFREQLAAGGPLTVTHPDITRFFMTLAEASLLVIQAGSLARGGEVFVLDMGEPVKIVQLARRMITLSGLQVKEANRPEGDIEIVFTGLRPGEKLYEELLIGEQVSGTLHPKILRAEEEALPSAELKQCLQTLQQAEATLDFELAQAALQNAVKGFTPTSACVDYLLGEANQSR